MPEKCLAERQGRASGDILRKINESNFDFYIFALTAIGSMYQKTKNIVKKGTVIVLTQIKHT